MVGLVSLATVAGAFAAGWALGSVVMWGYFVSNRLIRTRREWYADRRARGLWVPDDWDRDEADGV